MENAEDARWLEAVHTKDWLDLQIRILKERKESYRLNDFVGLHMPDDYILLGNGVGYITDLLGLELKESLRKYENDIYPFEYSFEYGGVKFFQISAERIPCPVCQEREEPEDGRTA